MKMREEQMQAFSEAAADQYEDRLGSFLQEQFPDAAPATTADLKTAVHHQVRQALSHGLVTERQIASYVVVAWILGPEFDRDFPSVQEILSSTRLSPDNKAAALTRLTDRLLVELEGEE